tara:strand:+ start:109 stop:576 length:468 start_codon:yes stop_codon:yes gene_type:complete
MATISEAAPTAGQPALSRQGYILEKVVDFSVIAGAVTIGTTDTVQVLKFPAYTWVASAGYEVLTAESTNTSAQVELGDGVDPNRWVASTTVAATGVSTPVATTSALGHNFGSSADTVDLLISVDDPTNAKLRVWALCYDVKPVGNTVDNSTWTSA